MLTFPLLPHLEGDPMNARLILLLLPTFVACRGGSVTLDDDKVSTTEPSDDTSTTIEPLRGIRMQNM